jgi:hypothetical protein
VYTILLLLCPEFQVFRNGTLFPPPHPHHIKSKRVTACDGASAASLPFFPFDLQIKIATCLPILSLCTRVLASTAPARSLPTGQRCSRHSRQLPSAWTQGAAAWTRCGVPCVCWRYEGCTGSKTDTADSIPAADGTPLTCRTHP